MNTPADKRTGASFILLAVCTLRTLLASQQEIVASGYLRALLPPPLMGKGVAAGFLLLTAIIAASELFLSKPYSFSVGTDGIASYH